MQYLTTPRQNKEYYQNTLKELQSYKKDSKCVIDGVKYSSSECPICNRAYQETIEDLRKLMAL